MSNYQYTTMDRIFSKLDRDVTSEFSEDDIIEWTGEALEFMQAPRAYEPFVAFIEIRNHQCAVPKWLHLIHQIARNNTWTGPKCNSMCPSTIASCLTPTISETGCVPTVGTNPCTCPPSDAVWLDCNGQPIVAYDLAYYRPFFNLKLESFNTFSNTGFYTKNFTPIRLSTNSMFRSLVCNPRPSPYTKSPYKDEYSIIQGKILRFSFRDGAIALAYDRQVVEVETGYPMIPDNISHTTAVVKYIALKRAEKDFDRGRQGAEARVKKYGDDWNWYCGQASCQDKMIVGIDEYQNFMDQRQYILPKTNSYYGFFGNLNDPEQRMWNNRFHNNTNIYRGEGVRPVGSGGDDIIISNSEEIIEDQWDSIQW